MSPLQIVLGALLFVFVLWLLQGMFSGTVLTVLVALAVGFFVWWLLTDGRTY
ncbi:hypothetical protein ISTM_7 [Insectomime virus]|uniref:Uncharacterized protein n=1 Tax=Tunisvirus fontaine2 TaxID=1421067 RepID=V9SDR6_9VIRU|nr:hypothetical protein D1R32_gp321 [Tunisvirus fontaine2]AHA45905.1 hypothetical protein ISTM_7 [Insectomime virus]AHC55038.1 hypothetical protein TNS_ORF320 [Tunisvirus fontaine2]